LWQLVLVAIRQEITKAMKKKGSKQHLTKKAAKPSNEKERGGNVCGLVAPAGAERD
jgi:hypothetical protein